MIKKKKPHATELNHQCSDILMSTAQPIKSPDDMFQKQSLYQHSKTPKFLKEESSTSQKLPEDEEAENQSKA